MSLEYDLFEMNAVLELCCRRERSKAREVVFMMLSLMLDMIGSRMS